MLIDVFFPGSVKVPSANANSTSDQLPNNVSGSHQPASDSSWLAQPLPQLTPPQNTTPGRVDVCGLPLLDPNPAGGKIREHDASPCPTSTDSDKHSPTSDSSRLILTAPQSTPIRALAHDESRADAHQKRRKQTTISDFFRSEKASSGTLLGLQPSTLSPPNISVEAITEVYRTFGGKKASGPDGIQPLALQKIGKLAASRIANIYQASLNMGHVPSTWRRAEIVLIPKTGKSNYNEAKSFRPITLSSFLLKGLEKLCYGS